MSAHTGQALELAAVLRSFVACEGGDRAYIEAVVIALEALAVKCATQTALLLRAREALQLANAFGVPAGYGAERDEIYFALKAVRKHLEGEKA